MTDATRKPPNVLELVAERFGVDAEIGSTHPSILDDPTRIGAGLPQREPGAAGRRLRAIAAIHALADHIAAHPDIPTPTYVTAGCQVADREEVAAVGAALGTRVYADGYQTDLQLTSGTDAGLNTTIIVSTWHPDRPL